jgi:hypothetical protein
LNSPENATRDTDTSGTSGKLSLVCKCRSTILIALQIQASLPRTPHLNEFRRDSIMARRLKASSKQVLPEQPWPGRYSGMLLTPSSQVLLWGLRTHLAYPSYWTTGLKIYLGTIKPARKGRCFKLEKNCRWVRNGRHRTAKTSRIRATIAKLHRDGGRT